MHTTKEIAARHGVAPQTVNRWIAEICKVENIDPEKFGTRSEKDKRVMVYSERELKLLEKHHEPPTPKSIDAELIAEGQTVSAPASGLVRYQMPTLATRRTDLSHLYAATQDTQNEAVSGVQALQEFMHMIGAGIGAEMNAQVGAVRATAQHALVSGMMSAVSPQNPESQLK